MMLSKQKKLLSSLIIACLVLLAGFVLVSALTFRKPRSSSSTQSNSHKQHIDAVVVTLQPTGFEPKEINRARGLFLLVVDNRSNNPDITLRLDHESGRREHEERVNGGRIDWQKPFDLHPGNYVLSEASHPNWVCNIRITGQ